MDDTVKERLWSTEVEILSEIDRICKKYNLVYYLAYGTLIGAIRHKGFIPWDDDIDITMPRNDYNKLKKICLEGKLNEKFFYQDVDTDPEYYLTYAKIRKNNTLFDESDTRHLNIHRGIFVDVFPLDRVERIDGFGFKLKSIFLRNLSHVIFMKKNGAPAVSRLNKMMYMFFKHFKTSQLIKLYDWVIGRKQKGNYYVYWDCLDDANTVDIYGEPIQIEFCGKLFNAPKGYDKILKKVYGDYMKLPPVEQRVNHNTAKILFEVTQ